MLAAANQHRADLSETFEWLGVMAIFPALGVTRLSWSKEVAADGRATEAAWIYLHMIEEYARHNGHAELIRECIDGVTGD